MKIQRRSLIFFLALGAAAFGQPAFTPPEEIEFRRASIISEGTRMSAELFSLKSLAGKRLPTVIMCHGWGGVAAGLRLQAMDFARAGYFVVAFDYRGWGESDSRLLLTGPAPKERPNHRFTAEVQEVREVVDPLDMTTDLLNAIHWVQGEPQCDTHRIGLWGSSYSGGHVVYAAARDPRVKATVSQVPALDSRNVIATEAERNKTYEEATRRARGEIGYPLPRARIVGNLQGGPVRERQALYAPVEDADKAPQCAMLFIVAEKEELFRNEDHAGKAYLRAKGPKKLVTIPGITHYGIYREARMEATKLGIEWFDLYLKK
ncbi:MAG: alpha/beta fold hydrolase [Acidobacteria bacterium]|nr:alpha/beta fold hydrolase [Acidobacteriota bacterium]